MQKLQDPDVLIIDQMTEDLKLSIGLACTLKRQYESILAPDPAAMWNLPQCISEDYDSTILEALNTFFQVVTFAVEERGQRHPFQGDGRARSFNGRPLTT